MWANVLMSGEQVLETYDRQLASLVEAIRFMIFIP